MSMPCEKRLELRLVQPLELDAFALVPVLGYYRLLAHCGVENYEPRVTALEVVDEKRMRGNGMEGNLRGCNLDSMRARKAEKGLRHPESVDWFDHASAALLLLVVLQPSPALAIAR